MRAAPAAIVAGAASLVTTLVGACWRSGPTPQQPEDPIGALLPRKPVVGLGEVHQFAGSDSCASCHAKEHAQHASSLHADTLAPVTGAKVLRLFKSDQVLADPELGLVYSLRLRNGKPFFRVQHLQDGATSEMSPSYVVGSGHLGYTFLFEQEGKLLESRLSYYSLPRKWSWTPGQERLPADENPLGHLLSSERAQDCLLCHSTALVAEGDDLRVKDSQPNVGCERCHGAGKAHIDGARRGMPGAIFGFKGADAATIMRLCGDCHRAPGTTDAAAMGTDIARFAGTALGQSKCYTLSGGRLSCVTCHNPHQKVVSKPAFYERVCRSCHVPSDAGQKSCPVSPDSGCIPCHMPAQRVDIPSDLKFHNHWIKPYVRLTR